MRTLTEEQRQAAFVREGGEWTLRPEYREGVAFARHNLVEDPLPCYARGLYGFDVILCRNVMIYFDRPTIAATVERLRGCLNDDGWLFVGHSEPNLEVFRTWQTIPVPGATLYRKQAGVPEDGGARGHGSGEREVAAAAGARAASPGPGTNSGGELLPRTEAGLRLVDRPAVFPPADKTPELPASPAPPAAKTGAALEKLCTLANMAQWQECADLCAELEERERLNAGFHFYRALAAEGLGKEAQAERCYRQALFLNRSFAPAHYHLGLLLEARGEFRQAERSYRNAENILAKIAPDEPAEGTSVSAGELRHAVEVRLSRLREREGER